jgi:NADH-quinone oxidoreductase subunit C/D
MKAIEELLSQFSCATVESNDKIYKVSVPKENLIEVVSVLRNNHTVPFDFLVDMVGMDYGNALGVIYILSNTSHPDYMLYLKTETTDREDPLLDSVCEYWDSADLYEREVHDFFGIRFINHPDMRRLFLRQDWKGFPLRKDYDTNPEINPVPTDNEELDDMEDMPVIELEHGKEYEHHHKFFDKDEYVVNFGPQHPSTHGVLHLRVSLDGEIIRKIDPNFGYIHRGIEKMCETYTYQQILHLPDRMDYVSGPINRHAVCLAIEKGVGLEVPQRAHCIRTIMDELARISSHLLGWGCMAMDMGSITAFVYGMRDREKIMDIFEETCGGRLMANYSVIGGVMADIHPNFQRRVKEFIPYMRKMLKEHHLLFTGNPIARNRMEGVGYLSKEKAISLGATGPVGRASGWSNDIRKIEPYAAYPLVDFKEILREGGMTFDRYIIRLDEIVESLHIIEQLIDNIPEGDYAAKTKAVIRLPEGEYFQRVENARGEFGIYINSRGDKYPYRVKFRSPSMTLVNTLKAISAKNKVADLIMIGGSLDYVIPCIDR